MLLLVGGESDFIRSKPIGSLSPSSDGWISSLPNSSAGRMDAKSFIVDRSFFVSLGHRCQIRRRSAVENIPRNYFTSG